MGRLNKGLIKCNDRQLIELALEQITPQVQDILISANADLDRYRHYQWPVISDREYSDGGPLSGIYQGLLYCRSDYLLTLPCDAPFISPDYAQRMLHAVLNSSRDCAVACSGERMEPVFALLSAGMDRQLSSYLSQGSRRTGEWLRQQNPVMVDFSDQEAMFTNINTPESLDSWQRTDRNA